MIKRGPYVVRVSGLGEGIHEYSFELDQRFFAAIEKSEIERGLVYARVILEKMAEVMTLHFSLSGEVEVICDRCLEPFMNRIEAEQLIFLKKGDSPGEAEDDVMIIGRDDHKIDIAQLLYEFTLLALPIQRIHPVSAGGISGCDPQMIGKLKAHQAKRKTREDHSDPRWDILKGIIEKNS